MIKISDIRTDGGTQSRAAINQDTVADYAEAMKDPDTVFPPAIVYYDGTSYWLADGFHRVAAWAQIGRAEVPAEVRQGTRRDAILHACGANSAHGLRRSKEDRRRAVMTLLEDDEWAAWSDREISRRVRVSPSTVAKYRAEIMGVTVQLDSEPRTYTTKHGTEAKMAVANIGARSSRNQDRDASDILPVEAERAAQEAASKVEAMTAEAEDPHAQERKALAKLTREGLEDEVIGLREENAELKAGARQSKATIASLTEKLSQHTADDKDEVIRRLNGKVKNAENARYRAEEKFSAEQRKNYALNKRIKELEQMGVVTL